MLLELPGGAGDAFGWLPQKQTPKQRWFIWVVGETPVGSGEVTEGRGDSPERVCHRWATQRCGTPLSPPARLGMCMPPPASHCFRAAPGGRSPRQRAAGLPAGAGVVKPELSTNSSCLSGRRAAGPSSATPTPTPWPRESHPDTLQLNVPNSRQQYQTPSAAQCHRAGGAGESRAGHWEQEAEMGGGCRKGLVSFAPSLGEPREAPHHGAACDMSALLVPHIP